MADASVFSGLWTYRSFRNDPAPVDGDPQKAIALFFAEALFDLRVTPAGEVSGVIDWGSGGLDLSGRSSGNQTSPVIEMAGRGRPGTETENWEYDYYGWLAHQWPSATAQVPAIVGSVIRAKPHGGAPAGYVASFVAVRQPG